MHAHQTEDDFMEGPLYCQESTCTFSTKWLYLLCNHLQSSHNIELKEDVHSFANTEGKHLFEGMYMYVYHHVHSCQNDFYYSFIEFLTWKSNLEETSTSCFVKSTGVKTDSAGNDVCYYYCNRSGFYNRRSTGKKKTKSQGTSKLNTYCTAFIKATKHRKTGKIQAQTCATHYGHLQQVEHI